MMGQTKKGEKLTPAVVRSAIQEAVKKAVAARDQAWMRAVENFRRRWESEVSDLVRQVDVDLHKVHFSPPPDEFTVEVTFGRRLRGGGRNGG